MIGIHRAMVRALEGSDAVTKNPKGVLGGPALRRLSGGHEHPGFVLYDNIFRGVLGWPQA